MVLLKAQEQRRNLGHGDDTRLSTDYSYECLQRRPSRADAALGGFSTVEQRGVTPSPPCDPPLSSSLPAATKGTQRRRRTCWTRVSFYSGDEDVQGLAALTRTPPLGDQVLEGEPSSRSRRRSSRRRGSCIRKIVEEKREVNRVPHQTCSKERGLFLRRERKAERSLSPSTVSNHSSVDHSR